jgi:molecular chaperone GrpE
LAVFLSYGVEQKKSAIMSERKKKNDHPEVEKKPDVNKQEEEAQDHAENTVSEKENENSGLHNDQQTSIKDKNQEKIEELEGSLLAMADKYLRLQAEFDNFRKRTLKEKAELIKSGGEAVLSSILPIIDDFDRALGTMKDVQEDDPAKIGFLLIFNKFKDFLKLNNIKEIEAAGAVFDVDLHFALTKIPAPNEDLTGKVVDVIEKGYLLHDKVLRYAKVVIGE